MSGLWEIIESWVARAVHPELGVTPFPGSQGDVWDVRRTAVGGASMGALLSMTLLLVVRALRGAVETALESEAAFSNNQSGMHGVESVQRTNEANHCRSR
ncbi:MAG: DUF2238 domain-containing protein [Nitrospira sp.]|nr:DUF2238 domain-containing protein [Nitrospira sp.]